MRYVDGRAIAWPFWHLAVKDVLSGRFAAPAPLTGWYHEEKAT
jgi:hypothetical protein